jgi:hypothetical protein
MDPTTEQEYRLRKHPSNIRHMVTICPNCGINNFWTKTETINGVAYYWQECASCGLKEI